jgi:hypothetical protein
MFAFTDMVDLFMYEFSGRGRWRFAFAEVLFSFLYGGLFRHFLILSDSIGYSCFASPLIKLDS